MLAPADAEIARRDPALPGLAVVLDDDALAECLRTARPELDVRSVRATYVRYKPGTSCLVGLRVGMAEGEAPVFAKAYRCGDGAKVAKARSKGRRPLAVVDQSMVVVAGVGGDRDLPAAARLATMSGRRRLLDRLLHGDLGDGEACLRGLRYKPERRWVGVVGDEGEQRALVKAYRRDDVARATAGLRYAARAGLAAPRLLASSRRWAVLASSWIPGETLSALLACPGEADPSLRAAGEALATLHAGPPAGLPVAGRQDDATALGAAADHLAALDPRLGAAARALVRSIGPRLAAGPPVSVVRHGDFSPDQVIGGSHGAAIVDFDDVEVGDPAADLGSFVAALWVLSPAPPASGPVGAGRLRSWAQNGEGDQSNAKAFLAGYEGAGGMVDSGRVADHTAAALVRLAVEPFRTRAPDWRARAEVLLVRAATLAGSRARTLV